MCVQITDVCAFIIQVFMNIVLDEAFEEKQGGEKVAIGMIVCDYSHSRTLFALETRRGRKLMTVYLSFQVIRGNSVVMLEVSITCHRTTFSGVLRQETNLLFLIGPGTYQRQIKCCGWTGKVNMSFYTFTVGNDLIAKEFTGWLLTE